ncbi:alpha-1,4-glucan--maltose-1-phosphate maltosyltransferase [Phragmitibacter flavus]|uniref:Alpha-1,4-glucan:maltose-1-phosphate maltosyltransferase n=1 Tax=Phragmitibacter flavus TaxID=2576071 RepID=A0A5R8KAH5_9BACT|nr:alpha-1,4-glucan--maltose-1-phosphate maltosyltransferase [Phragmitibacter flavus]TLD69301.1 alpha-1,4-glucan--maltose-1-phosphate maltosyltransferase [Phragmitibacter flavus]
MSSSSPPPAFAPAVVVENIYPSLGAPNYLIKRVVGEGLSVYADVFKDGHDVVSVMLKWRAQTGRLWTEVPMVALGNDRWKGDCSFAIAGRWEVVVEAWLDNWRGWKKHFKAKFDAGDAEIAIEAREGARMLEEAAARAEGLSAKEQAREIAEVAKMLRVVPAGEMMEVVMSDALQVLLDEFPDRTLSVSSEPLRVVVERERARFSAWYEFFPRSAEGRADKHSTFRDCLPRLDDAKAMGFDVIYLPPIHPIGMAHRKGKNNTLTAGPDDVGSPWAIGGAAGGHRMVEPALGTVEDLEWLVEEAQKRGMEIALDFALNCSPDHPYVKEHPDWFNQREDGSIRYAENPPKKYQDIYPLNFFCEDWKALWRELIDVVLFWVKRGVKIFRVDNPHTKPVAFWELLIAEVQAFDPDVLFLAEAFTKPRMMQVLGKVGFSQSYTYFTWRESKQELTEYAEELTKSEMRWYYRANFWPNTPDILPGHLQYAGAAMFKLRAALAATLMPSWGMYSGYELIENLPLPGREEYLDSEKYQLKERNWNAPGNIKAFIGRLNDVRRENRALQLYDNLTFHAADHPEMIVYSKVSGDFGNRILVVINLNAGQVSAGMVHLDLGALGLAADAHYRVEDLLHGAVYDWQGSHNFVSLDPNGLSMHLFRVVPG